MDIRYLGKNLDVTQGMKDHLEDKLHRFEKFAPKLVESHVVLKKEKYGFEAEVTLLGKNLRAYGEGNSKDNIFAAIDQASQRVETQLKKYRGKIKGHHGKKEAFVRDVKEAELKPSAKKSPKKKVKNKDPQLVQAETLAPKPMSPEEASDQLKLSKENFIVFLNSSTNHVNVIYKLKDGNHGLVEPKL